MGSPCELVLDGVEARMAESVYADVRAEIEALEARYSRYRSNSLISQINQAAGSGRAIDVDAELFALLRYADTCYQQSDGRFDVSSGPLRRAWRFDQPGLPSHATLEPLLTLVGWPKVSWDAECIHLPLAGMELDFGGIVKEYAADRIAQRVAAMGVRHGFIDLGGDLHLFGPKHNGEAWSVGLRHPRDPAALMGSVLMQSGAMATSGDYARSFVLDGVRYSHLLNPATGYPVRTVLIGVSVLAPLCVLAGSASTISMLMEEAGPDWLAGLGLQYAAMDAEGGIHGELLAQ